MVVLNLWAVGPALGCAGPAGESSVNLFIYQYLFICIHVKTIANYRHLNKHLNITEFSSKQFFSLNVIDSLMDKWHGHRLKNTGMYLVCVMLCEYTDM